MKKSAAGKPASAHQRQTLPLFDLGGVQASPPNRSFALAGAGLSDAGDRPSSRARSTLPADVAAALPPPPLIPPMKRRRRDGVERFEKLPDQELPWMLTAEAFSGIMVMLLLQVGQLIKKLACNNIW